jgi:hypothetical protein
MTSAVNIKAHTGPNKEVVIKIFNEGIEHLEYTLQDGEERTVQIYGEISVCTFERLVE